MAYALVGVVSFAASIVFLI